MDIILIILLGIPILGVVVAVVVLLRHDARNGRRSRKRRSEPGESLDGNLEAKTAAQAASMSRGGVFPF